MFELTTVPKKELRIAPTCLGNLSNIIKTKLTKIVNKNLKFWRLKVLIKTNTLKEYFHLEDLVLDTLRSNYIYKFSRKFHRFLRG